MRTKAENRDGARGPGRPGFVSGRPRRGDPLSIGDIAALIVSDLAAADRLQLPSFLQKFGPRLVFTADAVQGEEQAKAMDADDESGEGRE